MAEIVLTDVDEQSLRQIEVRAMYKSRTLEAELMELIIDGLSRIHEPDIVRVALRHSTIEIDDYQKLDDRVNNNE
jgi:plasmid stability protein